jgi:peptide/nickel transport system substrate-binding protein
MNQSVSPDSPYLGSGKLDGNGIPPDFFADVNVRRAMATCFDYDALNNDLMGGAGVRNNGPVIQDMLGYNPDGPMYEFDLEACEAYLAEAWGGVLPETGFRLPFVYPTSVPAAGDSGAILQGSLAAINEKYVVEPIGVSPSSFLPDMRGNLVPIFINGWIEDIHDPHNWAAPYTTGIFAGMTNIPEATREEFGALVSEGVSATDPAAREAAYFALQELYYEEIPAVILFQRADFHIEPRYVKGYQYRIGMVSVPYYYLSIDEE